MIVLGIHSFVHDSGACIVRDGRVHAISEERLDRKKHSAKFPRRAISYVLEEAGLDSINDADLVVYDMFERMGGETLRRIRALGYRGRAERIRHHDAHAASAYFASPFDDAAVLVVDGAGSDGNEYPDSKPSHYLSGSLDWMQEVQSFYRGNGASLDVVHRTFATPEHALGIGFLYGVTCEYLGFDKLDGGKLMGLAAYGKDYRRKRKNPFVDSNGDLLIPFNRDNLLRNDFSELRKNIYGGAPARAPGGKILASHRTAAARVQAVTEESMLLLARRLRAITGSKNLCIAGGVALNGPANTLIAREAGFSNVFVQPAANDYGIPLGCALYGHHVLLGGATRFRMKHAFLGREYSDAEVDAAIAKSGRRLKVERPRDVARAAALAIAEGKAAGCFGGASEFGPRALGCRSIIADPRRADMKDILNSRVKFREPFRPYAPAVLAERAAEFFDDSPPSPYMLFIVKAKPGVEKLVPAVLHVDGTARLQTVKRAAAPLLHSLIRRFDSITGIPMLLNTSMNVAGEPICETPADAIHCLLNTGLDLLIMNGRIITKK